MKLPQMNLYIEVEDVPTPPSASLKWRRGEEEEEKETNTKKERRSGRSRAEKELRGKARRPPLSPTRDQRSFCHNPPQKKKGIPKVKFLCHVERQALDRDLYHRGGLVIIRKNGGRHKMWENVSAAKESFPDLKIAQVDWPD